MINLFFPVAFGLSLGRIFVGIPFGDPAEVFPEFVLQVGAGQVFVGPFVIIAKIARVTTVAAAKFPGGGEGISSSKTVAPDSQAVIAARSIAASDDQHIVTSGKIDR
jgi:hypothetical protein